MSLPYTGAGITVAVLDTGIWPHIDFDQRIIHFQDFVNYRPLPYDNNSHGTHVAGIIAGSGLASQGRIHGIAPKANLVVLKILDKQGLGSSTTLIEALDWIIHNYKRYQIRIVNISVGGSESDFGKQRTINSYVEKLWKKGLVVVAAAGNMGPASGTITAPGSCCEIITVGSKDMLYEKSGASSRGPVLCCPHKPDILAEGNRIWSCFQKNSYIEKSGTSMSTPKVSGAIALLLEKEPYLDNDMIKYRLCATADTMNLDPNIQGCGCLNIKRLLA